MGWGENVVVVVLGCGVVGGNYWWLLLFTDLLLTTLVLCACAICTLAIFALAFSPACALGGSLLAALGFLVGALATNTFTFPCWAFAIITTLASNSSLLTTNLTLAVSTLAVFALAIITALTGLFALDGALAICTLAIVTLAVGPALAFCRGSLLCTT